MKYASSAISRIGEYTRKFQNKLDELALNIAQERGESIVTTEHVDEAWKRLQDE